jgi:CelD/BcsL family acetyltransferase involved in cellulose biosynthesis
VRAAENSEERLSVRIIEDPAAFAALETPWRTLDELPGVHPFQQFGWLSAWLNTLGAAGDWRLRVATLWRGERLIAVLPLGVRRYRGVRILEWMGSRVADYCDALVDPDVDAKAALSTLWEAVERRGGFDLARFNHLREDAHIFNTLAERDPWTETLEHAGGVPIRWSSGDEWLHAQSASMRDRVKYNARRMAKAGYEVRVWEPPEPYAPIIDVLVAQKRPWLAARGLSSMICEPEGAQFLHAVVAETARRGELHLSVVEKGDHIAACDLAFVRNGVIYSYLGSFDPDLAKYSFGRVLMDRLVMWACDKGLRRYDLLLGAYGYKSEYGCTLEPVRTQVIARSLIGRAAVALYRRRSERSREKIPAQDAV